MIPQVAQLEGGHGLGEFVAGSVTEPQFEQRAAPFHMVVGDHEQGVEFCRLAIVEDDDRLGCAENAVPRHAGGPDDQEYRDHHRGDRGERHVASGARQPTGAPLARSRDHVRRRFHPPGAPFAGGEFVVQVGGDPELIPVAQSCRPCQRHAVELYRSADRPDPPGAVA